MELQRAPFFLCGLKLVSVEVRFLSQRQQPLKIIIDMTNEQVTEKWDEIVELFGPQKALDELFRYMSRDDKQEFLEHLERYWEVEL